MGLTSSRLLHSAAREQSNASLEGFNLSNPTAAVVGAGIAGVHVAHELAQLGFDVTIFEQNSAVASGESKDALPFVGVGLLEPSLAHMRLYKELLYGLFFQSSCPNIISRDHLFNAACSSSVHRWMWGRSHSLLSEKDIMNCTNHLSRLSVATIRQLIHQHPTLANYIVSESASVRQLGDSTRCTPNEEPDASRRWVAAHTAHPSPLVVDPVGWTRELARICVSKLSVQLALNERVESITTQLKYDVEATSSIRVSRADLENPGERITEDRSFDVVVLASGAQTGSLTWQTSQLPVLGLSGVSVTMCPPRTELRQALQCIGCTTSAEEPRPVFTALSNASHLFGYSLPAAPAASHPINHISEGKANSSRASDVEVNEQPADFYRLQGLLSFDTTKKSTPPSGRSLLQRLEGYLRVKCGLEVPLINELESELARRGGEGAAAVQPAASVREYQRAFTPDGVPLVDHNGNSYNSFVCCGFGDRAMDFAPGASKILGKLVQLQAETLLEEDYRQLPQGIVATASLRQPQLQKTQCELQSLLSGILPESCPGSLTAAAPEPRASQWHLSTGAEARPSDVRASGEPRTTALETDKTNDGRRDGRGGVQNPFSTRRFKKLVVQDLKEGSHRSPLSYLDVAEQKLMEHAMPWSRYINQKATALARREGTPDFVRTVVFFYFYDADDDEEYQRERMQLVKGMRRLGEQYEHRGRHAATADGSGAASDSESEGGRRRTFTDLSEEREGEMERRAREMFGKTSST